MDDDYGWWYPPPNVYGDDGPVISRRCNCGRLVSLPDTITFNELRGVTTKINCSRCGTTDPVILCWASDIKNGTLD